MSSLEEYFRFDYQGTPFELFGIAHLATIALLLAAIVVVLFGWKNPTEHGKRRFRLGVGWMLVASELSWQVWNLAYGQWTVQTMLPLHLCSLTGWMAIYTLLSGDFQFYDFVYMLGIGGAFVTVLTPDLGIYGFPHFRFIQIFIGHMGIVLAGVYLVGVEKLRPTWNSFWRIVLYGNLYLLAIGAVNLLLGSNYMFTQHKPDGPSPLDYMGPWPWYLLSMEGLALLVCFLLFLPFLRSKPRMGAEEHR